MARLQSRKLDHQPWLVSCLENTTHSLHVTDHCCILNKRKRNAFQPIQNAFVRSYPAFHTFPMLFKRGCPSCPISPSFLYIFIYLLTCSCPEYAWDICLWTLSNQQALSINQSINHNICIFVLGQYCDKMYI